MDVGVSSMQLDQAERGFSFRLGGPLDMRMGHDGPTAADVVAKASRPISPTSSIHSAESVTRAPSRAPSWPRAKKRRSRRRKQLADIVGKVVRSKPNEIHPATRTFQGLRIFVNAELDELHLALAAAERVLKPGGRLVVVSFHSLEDRIVRGFLQRARQDRRRIAASCPNWRRPRRAFRILTKRPVTPDEAEVSANPRARSAKLRAAEAHRSAGACGGRAAGMACSRRRDEGRLIMRIIHFLVIGVLVFAAAYVYRIKMESTSRVERVLRLNAEIREQRDAIAALRAEWARLDAPLRLQGLAERHLGLKPLQRHAIRSAEELAGTAAELCKAGCARSDRRDDQHHRGGRRYTARRPARCPRREISNDRPGAQPQISSRAEPWRQRLIRSLLYGRNVGSRREGPRPCRIGDPGCSRRSMPCWPDGW